MEITQKWWNENIRPQLSKPASLLFESDLIEFGAKALGQLAAEQEKNRWRHVDDITDAEIEWDKTVEALEDGAEIPRFMTMADIFMDEGSEVAHWRPIHLPELRVHCFRTQNENQIRLFG